MKIQFDPNLSYEQEAIRSVTDIFEGQEDYGVKSSILESLVERIIKFAGDNG